MSTPLDIDVSTTKVEDDAERLFTAPRSGSLQHKSLSYRPDVDGLRAMAVSVVIMFHLNTAWLPGGFVGVDVFFVISGYVVTASLLKSPSPSTGAFLVAFYARRLKRLSPSLVLVVLATGLALSLFVDPSISALDSYYESGQFALIGFANNYLAFVQDGEHAAEAAEERGGARRLRARLPPRRHLINYFDQTEVESTVGLSANVEINPTQLRYNPFTHCWSLGVEEQFYLVFPCFLAATFCQRVVKKAPCTCTMRWLPTLVMCALLAIGVLVSALMTQSYPQFAFYLLPPRLWELLVGAVLCDLQAHHYPSATWFTTHGRLTLLLTEALDVSGLVCLVLALLYTENSHDFPFPWALLSTVGTLCFITAGCTPPTTLALPWPLSVVRSSTPLPLCNAVLSHKAFVHIGKLSYPLYLWHWPIFVLFRHARGSLDGTDMLLATILAIFSAFFTHHVLEGRVRNWKANRDWHVVAVMVLAIGVAELWLGLLRGPLHAKLFVLEPRATSNALGDVSGCVANPQSDAGPITVDWRKPDNETLVPQRPCACKVCDRTEHFPPGAITNISGSMQPCYVQGTNALMPELNDGTGNTAIWSTDCFARGWSLTNDTSWQWINFAMHPVLFDNGPSRQAVVDEWVRQCIETPHASESSKAPRLLLFGDSHAGALAITFLSALKNRMPVHYAAAIGGFDTYLPNGSLAAGIDYIRYQEDGATTHYLGKEAYTKAVWAALNRTLRAGDVVTSTLAEFRIPQTVVQQAHMDFLRYLQRFIESRGASLFLLGDVLKLRQQGRRCKTPQTVADCVTELSYEGQDTIHEAVMSQFRALASSSSSTFVFDLRPLLCEGQRCGATVPGTGDISYMDEHHISTAGALYLAPFINCFMESHWLLPPPNPPAAR